MKKFACSTVLFLLVFFMLFISPTNEINPISFDTADEPSISTTVNMTSSDIITESVHTNLQKWPTVNVFTFLHTPILQKELIPNKFFQHAYPLASMNGFIYAQHYQSNYLI